MEKLPFVCGSVYTLQAWIGWDILYQYSNSSSRHSVKINTPSHPPRRQLWFGWLQILIFLSPAIRLHSENMTVANNWNRVSSESSMPMRSETLNILLIWFLKPFPYSRSYLMYKHHCRFTLLAKSNCQRMVHVTEMDSVTKSKSGVVCQQVESKIWRFQLQNPSDWEVDAFRIQ